MSEQTAETTTTEPAKTRSGPNRRTYLVLVLLATILFVAAWVVKGSQTPDSIEIFKDLTYAGRPERGHLLDVYVPRGLKGPLPLIVFIHGGGWKLGDKTASPCMDIANDGFVAAAINYRFSQESIFPAQIYDAKAAIRYLRAHAGEYNIDPKRVGVWGVSAGGHLVSLLGTSGGVKELEGDEGNLEQSSTVQAVVDWCGPSDLTTICSQAGKDNELDLDEPSGPLAQLLGGLPKDKADLAKTGSAVTYIDKNDPPFLIVHGDKDTIVPYGQSTEFYDKLQAADVPSRLVKVKGGGHNVMSSDAVALTLRFFEKYLKG